MRTIKGEVVLEYLDKWPNVPNLTLAKKIYKENPKVFTSIEQVRSMIRMYRGRNGDNNRKRGTKDKRHYKDGPINFNPFGLPDSEAEDDTVFVIPDQYKRIGVIADLHVPYHDVEALTTAIQFLIEKKCQAVIINGDAVDFYQLSRFDKDPRNRDVGYELDSLAAIIKVLKDKFGKVFYKIGNHEERYERYLRVKAPELLNVPDFQLENLLVQRGAECEVVRHAKIMAGKMPIVHGHEFQSKATGQVNPARSLMLKNYSHGIVAHSHRTSQHTEVTVSGKLLVTFSIGCLCGLYPEWARINKWNHGVAYLEIDEDGAFDVDNLRIHKGRVRS